MNKRMKKSLYESIMKTVSKTIKKSLLETVDDDDFFSDLGYDTEKEITFLVDSKYYSFKDANVGDILTYDGNTLGLNTNDTAIGICVASKNDTTDNYPRFADIYVYNLLIDMGYTTYTEYICRGFSISPENYLCNFNSNITDEFRKLIRTLPTQQLKENKRNPNYHDPKFYIKYLNGYELTKDILDKSTIYDSGWDIFTRTNNINKNLYNYKSPKKFPLLCNTDLFEYYIPAIGELALYYNNNKNLPKEYRLNEELSYWSSTIDNFSNAYIFECDGYYMGDIHPTVNIESRSSGAGYIPFIKIKNMD